MVLFKNKSWNYRFWTFILIIFLCLYMGENSYSEILSGIVNKEDYVNHNETGTIYNNRTGAPVSGAMVSVPSEGKSAVTNKFGEFQLSIPDKRPLILAVQAEGYRPFSLIIDEDGIQTPMKIGIEEKSRNELVVDTRLHHLGDNKFSDRSANAGDFSSSADGHYYFKEFFVENSESRAGALLKIGSVIGVDTITAQNLRQSNILTSSSSPVEIFFNSRKIGEINANGNNHTFRIPSGLLRVNSYNHVRIDTGINLNSGSHKDYDDMEFIHVVLEFL